MATVFTVSLRSYSAHVHNVTTVERRLSDSRLSVPSIIWNGVQKFLKQVIPNC